MDRIMAGQPATAQGGLAASAAEPAHGAGAAPGTGPDHAADAGRGAGPDSAAGTVRGTGSGHASEPDSAAEVAHAADDGLVQADDLPDGLVIADHEGLITVFNRAAGRLTGLDPGSVVGRAVSDVLALRDVEGNCWWSETRPYGGLSTRTRHPERSLYLPDGTELLVSVGYVRDWHPDGPPAGDGPGNDEPGTVRRLAITLRDAQQRARAERSRADLVSTVAHELRSPLTSVKGFTATLLNKWPRFTDDQKRVMLETVNADADRVTRLITELLDVSRIESGRIEVHRELVDIPELARRVIAGRVSVGEAEDKFRLEVGPGLPETWLDADKVFQILANLIENAVRHGAGTVTVMVESAPETGAPGVAVSVRDQGQGIAPELAPRVFRQFWRVKRRGGAGLGLFIVKGLVEAHGGTIEVREAPGGGAEFRFTMPAGTPEYA
ncbi:MAG TPA: PAS domain-containing sensor histidine kinase [Streptosporangiaceae bacterium]